MSQINSKPANLRKIGQTTYKDLFLLEDYQTTNDKAIINVSLSTLKEYRLAEDPKAFTCSQLPSLSLPYLRTFSPLLGTFPPMHTLLPSEFAAAVTVGLFNPLLGGEKSPRVSGQKASCYNVTQVTSVQPVLTNGNKSHGN